jgi:hypothetical protein
VIIVAVTVSTRRHVAIADEPGETPALPGAEPTPTEGLPAPRKLPGERELHTEGALPIHQQETKARK